MELPGTSYPYTNATLSITYAGFAALIVTFRQIIGGGVSIYNVFVIRSVLKRSFVFSFAAVIFLYAGMMKVSLAADALNPSDQEYLRIHKVFLPDMTNQQKAHLHFLISDPKSAGAVKDKAINDYLNKVALDNLWQVIQAPAKK
jgi:hypothetical protein